MADSEGVGPRLIVGLTGVGGGSLMTPILIFFFGIKPHMAVGTDLLFAACTKMGGTVSRRPSVFTLPSSGTMRSCIR